MKLTARQQKFVNEYLVSGNATKAAVAAGYSQKTAYSAGGRLLKNVEVSTVIAARQQKASEKANLTLEAHLERLNDLANKAAAAEQFGPAVTAEVNRGKAAGLYVERSQTEITGAAGGPLELTVRFVGAGK